MALHLVLSPGNDLDKFRTESEQGRSPRHAMAVLADRIGAIVHVPHPDRDRPNTFDRMAAKLIGPAEVWALARRLVGELGPDDLIYCQGEDVGLSLTAMIGARSKRSKQSNLILYVDNITSRRGQVLSRLFRIAKRVDAFGVCCSRQGDFFRRDLKIADSRIHLLLEHVDNHFFSPGPASPEKARPVIVGVGLEKRDYRTLAVACEGLDVDIRISGFSRFAVAINKSMPDPMPANMTRRYYSWPDLVQLYRDADVVVASVFPCLYAAGVTTLMEGLCCRRPVVVTRSPGLSDYLEPQDGLSIVEPQNSEDMRRAIVRLLDHPDEAQEQAERGYQLASRRYDFDSAVNRLERLLHSF